MWETYDGFTGMGNPAGVDAGMVSAVGIQHYDRTVPDPEPVGTPGLAGDGLFRIGIQGQCQDDTAILPHLQTCRPAVIRSIDPYSDGDADECEQDKNDDICSA